MSGCNFFRGKQLRVYEGRNQGTRCAVIRDAHGDPERAHRLATTLPSAACSAHRTRAVMSRQASTACPRGVAPLRHHATSRDIPVAHTGGTTPQSPHHATGCEAHPSVLFAPPGHGLAITGCSLEPIDMT